LSKHKKVEASFLQTEDIGSAYLASACNESHELHPKILSVTECAFKNKDQISKGPIPGTTISVFIFWAK
jgi:hypothetical protein